MTTMLRRLASLWMTLALIVGAGAIALAGLQTGQDFGLWMAVPFVLLFINLMAAIAVHERLRRQRGLLVFHLGLAFIALIAAVGHAMSLTGHVEVTQGADFTPDQVVADTAVLHRAALSDVRFTQGRFDIDYAPGMKRGQTRSHVVLPDGREVVVGDDHPLVIDGYRFYTTPNKGFAAIIGFDGGGTKLEGMAVHFPSYPMNEDLQTTPLQLPDGSREVRLWLSFAKPAYDVDRAWSFHLPEDATLVVLDGEARHELRPGQAAQIAGQTLRYQGLTSWMGYTIYYLPVLPWLAAAALVAVAGLAWHAVGRLRLLLDINAEPSHAA